MSSIDQKLITIEAFVQMPRPEDGSRLELKQGAIVTTPPPGFRHGKALFHIAKILDRHVEENQLGQVVPETGMVTERGPDSVRGPDIAFWSIERLALDAVPEVYPDVAADLCVEILSPGETPGSMHHKVEEYFHCGVRMAWLVDLEDHTVTVYASADVGRLLHESATLSGDEVLAGFSCRVGDLFPQAQPRRES